MIFISASPRLLEKCIKFHDSEIVLVDMNRLRGRWDRHLISFKLFAPYDYGVAELDETGEGVKFKYM